jgi:uncharacterized Zn finger protein
MKGLLEFPIKCEQCSSVDVEYLGEAYDDEEYLGHERRCRECGRQFHAEQFDSEDNGYFDIEGE